MPNSLIMLRNAAQQQIQKINMYAVALVAGACIGIGFPFAKFWPLAFLGIALLVSVALKTTKHKERFLFGYVSGAAASLFVFAPFFFSALPLTWLSLQPSHVHIAVTVFLWLLLAVYLGLPVGIFTFLLRMIATNTWFDVPALSALWVLCELGNSVVLYFFGYGNGSLGVVHHTIDYVGYLVADDSVLLQLAQFGSVYLLSFCVVVISLLLYKYWSASTKTSKKWYRNTLIAIAIIVICVHMGVAMVSTVHELDTSTDGFHIGVLSMYDPAVSAMATTSNATNIDITTQLLSAFNGIGIQLLVLPRNVAYLALMSNSGTTTNDSATDMYKTFMNIGYGGIMPLTIDSRDISPFNGLHLEQVSLFKSATDVTDMQQELLFPFTQYMPLPLQKLFELFAGKAFVHKLAENGQYSGSEDTYRTKEPFAVGVRVDGEVESPTLYQRQTQHGAQVLVDLASLEAFHGSLMVHNYMYRMAKVRAVENGRWLVASGRMSPAFVLDDHGQTVIDGKPYADEALTVYIHTEDYLTPYVRFGVRSVLPVLLILVCIGGMYSFWKKKYAR